MKKIISCFMALILMVSALTLSSAAGYTDRELALGVELGIAPYKAKNTTVTFSEYFTMLDNTLEQINAQKLTSWKKKYKKMRTSSEKMKRYDGMFCVLLLAKHIGGEYYTLNNNTIWSTLDSLSDDIWAFAPNPIYSSLTKKKAGLNEDWDYYSAAVFYNLGRISLYNDKTLFTVYTKSKSTKPDAKLSYQDAIRSLVRLYESSVTTFPVKERTDSTEDKKILAQAQQRIDEILSSPTTVTVKGTKYYVSNSGNDNNDGLSPETAWKTLDKVNQAGWEILKENDGVFFERGGLWRGILYCAYGVTYSAYGEGDKPKLYGSPENGSGAEKWTLYYNRDGKKIWKFYKDLADCGNIVFNEGESNAFRVFSYWNGKENVSLSDYKTKFNMKNELKYDLSFYSTFDSIGDYEIPYPVGDVDNRGPLYLRCDKGNPGELYGSIEFQSSTVSPEGYSAIVGCAGNNIIDNLCVKYSSTICVATYSTDGNTVQNCELAYAGGTTLVIGQGYIPTAGEVYRMDGSNNSSINNYIHDSFDGGATIESDKLNNNTNKNDTIKGNVITNCMSGVLVLEHNADIDNTMLSFENIDISDNMILYSGSGWSSDPRYDFSWRTANYDGTAINLCDSPTYNKEIRIINNTLYLAKASLMHIPCVGDSFPIISGNTYVQNKNAKICYLRKSLNEMIFPYYYFTKSHIKSAIRNLLNDKTGKIIY